MDEDICPACNGMAIVRKDGMPVKHGYTSMRQIMAEHNCCKFCPAGEKESIWWLEWRSLEFELAAMEVMSA